MATVVNFIDVTLQAATTRTVPIPGTTVVDWMGAAASISLIAIGADGSLAGAGGGQATLSGMGLKNYRVIASGSSATGVPASAGIYQNGTLMYAGSNTYRVTVLSRSTGLIVSSTAYDLYVSGSPAAMAANLNGLSSDKIVVVHSFAEPQVDRFLSGVDAAMYRCGASRTVFGSPNVKLYSAYILVGIPGCGEGGGAEGYQGSVDHDPNAWCDLGFAIVNGDLVGVSSSFIPLTLTDYGYTGAMDATKGAPSGTSVAGVLADTLVSQASSGAAASTALASPPVIAAISDQVGGIGTSGANTTVATVTLSISGGLAPYLRPTWTSALVSSTGLALTWSLNTAGTTITIKASTRTASDCSYDFTVIVVDSRGISCTQKFNVYCDAS